MNHPDLENGIIHPRQPKAFTDSVLDLAAYADRAQREL
jgi:hypothetical protein